MEIFAWSNVHVEEVTPQDIHLQIVIQKNISQFVENIQRYTGRLYVSMYY